MAVEGEAFVEGLLQIAGVSSHTLVEIRRRPERAMTRRLVEEQRWGRLWIATDAEGPAPFGHESVDPSNINHLLRRGQTPEHLDLVVFDLPECEYWVWEALHFSPRYVVVGYNALLGSQDCRVVPFDPGYRWDGRTDYFGASLQALDRLGRRKGYALCKCDDSGRYAAFVSYSVANPTQFPSVETLFREYRGPSLHNVADRPWSDPEAPEPGPASHNAPAIGNQASKLALERSRG